MIKITYKDSVALRERYPDISITRTAHHYYVEDTNAVRSVLQYSARKVKPNA